LLQRDYRLSEREVEVILLISQGHTQAYCADAMVLSVNTVRSHMKNLYTKLDIHSKEELLEMLNSVADE
jgi:DNA-binding CsgD family transcriptional regulator